MAEETRTPAPEGAADDRRQFLARDKDAMLPGEERRFKSKRRRKVSYLTVNKIDTVDYKEVNILRRFLNERGKILPSRQTGNTAKQQRMISLAIRRAREMALLPFVVAEPTERREPRRERAPVAPPPIEAPPAVETPAVEAQAQAPEGESSAAETQ